MQIIIKDGQLVATHDEGQYVDHLYPGAIVLSGLTLQYTAPQGTYGQDDFVPPQPIVPTLTLAEWQTQRKAAVDRLAKSKFDSVVANTSAAEMAAWPILRTEAAAYQVSGLDADAPNIAQEALDRGISTAALVSKVLNKAALFSSLKSGISGAEGKHCDTIDTLTSEAEVLAYDITTGWPV